MGKSWAVSHTPATMPTTSSVGPWEQMSEGCLHADTGLKPHTSHSGYTTQEAGLNSLLQLCEPQIYTSIASSVNSAPAGHPKRHGSSHSWDESGLSRCGLCESMHTGAGLGQCLSCHHSSQNGLRHLNTVIDLCWWPDDSNT